MQLFSVVCIYIVYCNMKKNKINIKKIQVGQSRWVNAILHG